MRQDIEEYTLDEVQEGIRSICNEIRASKVGFDFIVSISRGGLIPGVLMSHNLEIPLRVVEWSTRDTGLKLCPEDIKLSAQQGKTILIVDDIVDSGLTIRELIDSWELEDTPNIKVACLTYNIAQKLIKPDYFDSTINRDYNKNWINFWWEKK